MEELIREECRKLGREADSEPFVELFRANWIETLSDYVQYHQSLGGRVPVKLHAALMQRAQGEGISQEVTRAFFPKNSFVPPMRLLCSPFALARYPLQPLRPLPTFLAPVSRPLLLCSSQLKNRVW